MVKFEWFFFGLASGIPKPQQPLRKPKTTGKRGGKWWIHRIHPDSKTIQVMGKFHFISCAISGVPGVRRHNWTDLRTTHHRFLKSPLPTKSLVKSQYWQQKKRWSIVAVGQALKKTKMAWCIHLLPACTASLPPKESAGQFVNFEMLVLLDGLCY